MFATSLKDSLEIVEIERLLFILHNVYKTNPHDPSEDELSSLESSTNTTLLKRFGY